MRCWLFLQSFAFPGLVACRLVNQGAPILPYFARICLPSEANRHFGVLLPFCVVYEQRSGGLNSHSNLDNCIVIDSRKHGSEARDIRRFVLCESFDMYEKVSIYCNILINV